MFDVPGCGKRVPGGIWGPRLRRFDPTKSSFGLHPLTISSNMAGSVVDGPMHSENPQYLPIYYSGADTEPSNNATVLDLPQLHTKPSPQSLLFTLSQLERQLSSWDLNSAKSETSRSIDPEGVASYLTRIISSPLKWIENDEDKEAVWESASKRLSERSGRSAMPSLSRAFRIPVPDEGGDTAAMKAACLKIQIHEPSLTGDNLGHKTWIASYLLAKRLPVMVLQHFPSIKLLGSFHRSKSIDNGAVSLAPKDVRPKILELGAGTGLLGLAAAGLFSVEVHLTDLPFILPNLEHNVRQNRVSAEANGSSITTGVLDWSENRKTQDQQERCDIILAADSLYAPEHSEWLVETMEHYLRRGAESRIFVELPLRPGSTYPSEFKQKMKSAGFELLEDGKENGYDDWEASCWEGIEVTCWYSVWAWTQKRFSPSLKPLS